MANQDAKKDLIPYVTFPVPSLRTTPSPGTCKEERLETVISNLDRHQQSVRLNIIEAAKQNHASQIQHNKPYIPENHVSPDNASDGMDLFFANLNAPWNESIGDPSATAPAPPPPPRTMVRQKMPPPEIQLAKETLDRIVLYDSIALPARNFYAEALSRMTGASAASVDPTRASGNHPQLCARPSPWESTSRSGSLSRVGSGTFGKPSPADPRLAGAGRLRTNRIQFQVRRRGRVTRG